MCLSCGLLGGGGGGALLSECLFASCGLGLASLRSRSLDLLRSGELERDSGETPVLGAAGREGSAWLSKFRSALIIGLGGGAAVFHHLE